MAKLVTAQPRFRILVANIENAGDPSRGINPTKLRTGFEMQMCPEIGRAEGFTRTLSVGAPGLTTYAGGLLESTVPGVPVASTGTVNADDNDFTSIATMYLGDYVLVSDVDYAADGEALADVATNLAAAISALPEFSAVAVGTLVTITGPFGIDGNVQRLAVVYAGSIQNFTLTPTTGFLAGGEPTLGPPEIL